MPPQQTFHIYTAVTDAADFATLAAQVAPLKKYGPVEMMVSSLAEPTRADMPPGGSPWHEYASCLPTWQKFFPHPKMIPFMDMTHVKKNRALLADSLKVLRRHGYTAAFSHHTPFFMPEEFFARYPHLRGARCDHPRRTHRHAFALCADHPESLQMYTEMAAEMIAEIPELSWIRLVTNDAGAGFCWSDWLYPGPNGNAACKHITTADRTHTLMNAVRKGLGEDKPIDIAYLGNFSESETREMSAHANDLFHVQQHFIRRSHPYQIDTGSRIDNPVRGIIDPVAILKQLDRIHDPAAKRLAINFRFNYSRGHELEDTAEKVIQIISEFYAAPAFGTLNRLTFLRTLCEKWVGVKKRDDLLEALIDMHEAFTQKHLVAPLFTGNYCGVSMRAINRPLVILPELLTPEEEAYFLPHVFNPSIAEARTDYLDWHGGIMTGGKPTGEASVNSDPRIAHIDLFCETLNTVADTLADLGTNPDAQFFARMAISLRLYASVMRSINNTFSVGTLRNRNQEKLAAPPHIPPKLGDWIGDPDLQLLNAAMRDELDNTAVMIHLLENGGLRQMLLAPTPDLEDTFLLGPNLIDNLKQKSAIMARHWTDAEKYLSSPHK